VIALAAVVGEPVFTLEDLLALPRTVTVTN